ncbi:MAG: HAD-IIA family hydrolase [Acidimicrobiales bacterium]
MGRVTDAPTWLVDLDGVVWLAGQPIAGAGEAVAAVRESGRRTLFVTNNSGPMKSVFVSRLHDAGIEAGIHEIATASDAAASLLSMGEEVFIWGEDGLAEAVEAAGGRIVDTPEKAVTVIVGWSTSFNFELLSRVSSAVRDGARFIGANEDPTHPTPSGLQPGTGALLAAVAAASHTVPTVAGKPHEAMVNLVNSMSSDNIEVAIGDRPSTDGLFAARLGLPFALVSSDATAHEDVRDGVNPVCQASSLLEVVNILLSRF